MIREKKAIQKLVKVLDEEVKQKKIKEQIEQKEKEISENPLITDIVNIVKEHKNIFFDKDGKLTTPGVCFFIAISLEILDAYKRVKYGNKN